MKTIRCNTFETNSSSAHVATICGKDKLEAYKAHKVMCVFDFCYCSDGDGEVNVVPDSAFVSFEKAIEDLKKWYENPEKRETFSRDQYVEETKTLLENGFTAKDLEEALVNKKSFHDLDDWDIHEIFEEGVYEGTRVYIYDEGGEDEPFCADEVEVGTVDIKGPLVSLCTEVCC